VDLLRAGALLIGFLAILFWDRRSETWLQAELLFVSLSGAFAFFAPASALDFQTDGQTNVVHEMTIQAIGSFSICYAFLLYAATNDQGGRNLRYVLTAIVSTVLFGLHLYGHIQYKNEKLSFTLQHCCFTLLVAGLYAFGNFVQLYRATSDGSAPTTLVVNNSGLNRHLLIDGFVYVLAGFMDYGFPDFGLSFIAIKGFTPDRVLDLFTRHGGVLEIFNGLLSIFYCGLSNDSDKRALLRCRILMILMVIPLVFLYQFKHGLMSTRDFYFTLGTVAFQFGNCVCALYGKAILGRLPLKKRY